MSPFPSRSPVLTAHSVSILTDVGIEGATPSFSPDVESEFFTCDTEFSLLDVADVQPGSRSASPGQMSEAHRS